MNELRFLEVMGKIDEDLLREADVDIEKQYGADPFISKKRIYAFGSVAAAAVVTVGSVAVYNSHNHSDLIADHSIIQQDLSDKDDVVSNNNGTSLAADNNDPAEKSTLKENDIRQTDPADHQDVSVVDDPLIQPTTVKNSNGSFPSTDNNTSQNTEPPGNGTKGGVSTENCYFQPFIALIDPDSDAFGTDELHHIDVRTADGFYRQLSLDEYDANGISSEISNSDLGGYIGKIVEVNDYDYHGNGAESQEPVIAGADVYYYSGSGKNKALIVVKKGDQCSIFIDDNVNVSSGFQNGLAFFDVQSADDIQTIEYHVDAPDENGRIINFAQKTITDTETIKEIYELLCQLQPEDYSNLPEYLGTPQWLVSAWENYKNDPNSPAREDYGITIKLKDGTVLQDISYQPYLGNGYIEGMQELTPEQNNALRMLLG